MSAIRPDLPMPDQRAFLPPRQAGTAQTAEITATALANGVKPPATPPSPLKGRVRKRARGEGESRAAGAGEAIALSRTPKRSRPATTFASPVRGSPLGSLQVSPDGAVVSASRSRSGAGPANLSAETALSPMKYHDPASLASGSHSRTLEHRRVLRHTIISGSPGSRRSTEGDMKAIRKALRKNTEFRNASVFCVERKGSDGKMRRNYFIVHSNYSASGGHRFFPVAGTNCLVVPGNRISLWHDQYQALKRERGFRAPTFETFIRFKLAHEPLPSRY